MLRPMLPSMPGPLAPAPLLIQAPQLPNKAVKTDERLLPYVAGDTQRVLVPRDRAGWQMQMRERRRKLDISRCKLGRQEFGKPRAKRDFRSDMMPVRQ